MTWQGITTLVSVALLAAACGQNLGDAPAPTGPLRALNPDKWNWRENHLLTRAGSTATPAPGYRSASTASAGGPSP